MNKDIKLDSKVIGLVASIIFAIGTVFGFFMLWTASKNYSDTLPISDDLLPVEIDSVKKDAENILSNLEKVSDIPIALPVDKMGKENPFASS